MTKNEVMLRFNIIHEDSTMMESMNLEAENQRIYPTYTL